MNGIYRMLNECVNWTKNDKILEEYHKHEWCKIRHDDNYEFEMLSLEGTSCGLSWQTILHKRKAYRQAFHEFNIDDCSKMSDQELLALVDNKDIIRNKTKIFSVRDNALAILDIQKEFGSFDQYLWHFSDYKQIDNKYNKLSDIPAYSTLSINLSKDFKKRKIKFMGPVITYSFLQAIGIVNDHIRTCPYR